MIDSVYVECDNILSDAECQHHIEFLENMMTSPDGMFNRIFARSDDDLSLLVKQRLTLHGFDMSYKFLSKTWYYTAYKHGESLAQHVDGHKHEEGGHSILTILIYLNMHPNFDGGETCVIECDNNMQYIVPATGKGLLMSQDVLHKGCKVTNGTKYVLRGDIMMRTDTKK